MKALLLAAGRGERLKPVTDSIPKCLVPIGGKPLLEYWLDLLSNTMINEFYINTFYFAEAVEKFVKESDYADRITLIPEENLLGTGGTLKRNAHLFLNDDFFLAHADNLCLTNFKDFLGSHQKRPKNIAMTMMTFKPSDPKSCGVVDLDEQNIVQNFYEKIESPPTSIANGAVFVMSPEVAEYASNVEEDCFEISLRIIPSFTGRILAWHNNEYHLDIGTPMAYQQTQNENKRIQQLYRNHWCLK